MGEGDQTQPHCKDKRDLLTIKQGEDWWTESHKGTKRKGDSGQIAFDKAFAGDRASSGGTDGKESACSARDPGLIPGSGRSPGEGKGYPLQYSGLEIPWTEIQSMESPWGHKVSNRTEQLTLSPCWRQARVTRH